MGCKAAHYNCARQRLLILTPPAKKDNRMREFLSARVGRRMVGAIALLGGIIGVADGRADNERLVPWKAPGPKELWSREVGEGFAGLAVVQDRGVLFHRVGNELVAELLDANSGQSLWKTSFPTRYRGAISPDSGPRCVPVIHRQRVYLLGPGGELACVDVATGKKVWEHNILNEFDAPEGYFGTGSSPLVVGDKLLLNVGARGAGIVAFDLADGKVLWQATDEAASYSSPVETTQQGVHQVVFVTRLNVVSIDPERGEVLFRFPFGQRGPTVNAANPLVLGDHLFVTAKYGVGAVWAKIGSRSATPVWESDSVMSSQYSTCVEHDGVLYGIDGRQDVGVARLRAFDPRTGKIYWTEENFGTGNLILAGGRILVMKTDGRLVLMNPSRERYEPLAEAVLLPTTVQALPAHSNGRLYVRDEHTLKCVIVGQTAGKL
jgi:outer membrane protein assembly factor BamB